MAESEKYNRNEGPYADGNTVAYRNTPQGTVVTHLDSDRKPLGETLLTPEMAMKMNTAAFEMRLASKYPEFHKRAQALAARKAEKDAEIQKDKYVADAHANATMSAAGTHEKGANYRSDADRNAPPKPQVIQDENGAYGIKDESDKDEK